MFLTDLVKKLEPRFVPTDTVIYSELDEITEVIFFTDGKFDLGFEVNGERFFVLRYQNSLKRNVKSYGEAIGDYGCTFNKNSRFIYLTQMRCEGYFIRKLYWKEIM